MSSIHQRIVENLGLVIKGKEEVLRLFGVVLLAGGNVLMEDVPGVGKTTLAKTLACTIEADFKRVQFTPDLLPADILGASIYNPKEGSFHFEAGPIFTNILLADEINRASPRTQSALLEAMSEGQVTIEGTRHQLPQPFMVLATQNPVEFHGTYPLPEAQLDRFTMLLNMGYPPRDNEKEVLLAQQRRHPLEDLKAAVDLDEIRQAHDEVRQVRVEEASVDYIMNLIEETRRDGRLKLGSSPRGSLALFRSAQAMAYSEGRDYVRPDDIKALAVPVLAHRLVLDTKARYAGISKAEIVREILTKAVVPT
ncbi:MAG: AAA family ATPase [Vulcanimicrobiota bacterium]